MNICLQFSLELKNLPTPTPKKSCVCDEKEQQMAEKHKGLIYFIFYSENLDHCTAAAAEEGMVYERLQKFSDPFGDYLVTCAMASFFMVEFSGMSILTSLV